MERVAGSVRAARAERKLVTMLFADLAGFTSLAEKLDPEDVYGFLRPTMAELQEIVESYGGTVPQLLGDGFMAVFGVPVAHEDDAERAVRAALDVRDRIGILNRERRGIQLPAVHAGLNSGEVMVGPSDEPAGFRVVGDTVNTAARLAASAPAGHILVDETTRKRTRDVIRYGPRRLLAVRGKSDRIPAFEARGRSQPRGPGPQRAFVDRHGVLGLLRQELDQSARERCSRVLVITGEPGIGKSSVAAALGRSLPADRFLVGRCPPFGSRPLLSAMSEAVGGALGLVPGAATSTARAAIDRAARRIGHRRLPGGLAADLRALVGLDDGVPRSERDAAHAARLVLEDCARSGPVVVVLDDLHWADQALLDLLADAHRNPWRAPVLLLGLSRTRLPGLPSTPLTGLDPDSMQSLAELLLGGGSTEAAGVPIARANGNALFLEEMVEMLLETGALREREGSGRAGVPWVAHEVPQSIRLLIAARLDTLPVDEKELLQDASVSGTVTWDGLLAEVSDVADRRAALRGLAARGLLHRNPRSTYPGTTEYEWKHALIRDVAYRALPKAVRAQRHAQVADWLLSTAQAGRQPVASIAYHYEQAWHLASSSAGPAPDLAVARQAAEYLTRWAEQTFTHQARGSQPLFRRALRMSEEAGRAADAAVTARAAAGLAEALIEMGSHAEAIEQATRARRLADRVGDEDLAARALLALGRSENDAGHLRRARTLLKGARIRFEAAGDLRGQGWAVHRLSETWEWDDLGREVSDLNDAYRLFARAGDRFGRAVAANDLAYLRSIEGGREFHRWYEQARRLVEGEGDLRSRAALLRTWAHYCFYSGRFTESMQVARECRPVAAEAGDRYTESDALLILASAGVRIGDPGLATSQAREAAAIGNRIGSVRIQALARLAIGRAVVRTGRPAAAAGSLRQARDAIAEHGIRVMHGDLAEAEVMVVLDRGLWDRVEPAAQALEQALREVPMGLWAPLPALMRGRGLLGAGHPAAARSAFGEAVDAAGEAGAGGTLVLARAYAKQAALLAGRPAGRVAGPTQDDDGEVAAVAAETAGVAALCRHDAGAAVTALDEAVERWERFGSTSWLARSLALRADALRVAGLRAPAAASMRRARDTMDALATPARHRASVERPLEARG